MDIIEAYEKHMDKKIYETTFMEYCVKFTQMQELLLDAYCEQLEMERCQ